MINSNENDTENEKQITEIRHINRHRPRHRHKYGHVFLLGKKIFIAFTKSSIKQKL